LTHKPTPPSLADSFARAGYLTVAPDLFNGTPAPSDLNDPSFNTTAFLAAHGPEAVEPLIARAIAYLRAAGVQKVAATGYCYGGRYAFRSVARGKGADAAFAAHPSLLEDGEILAIAGPASVAAAGEFVSLLLVMRLGGSLGLKNSDTETDSMMPPARRAQIEALLANTTQPYQVSLYSGTQHGFGVRANVSDPEQKFGKESAFFQAVRWFETWA